MSVFGAEIGDEPLEYRLKTTSFPQISDEMVASLALGLEDDLVVAARHGLSVEQFAELERQETERRAKANGASSGAAEVRAPPPAPSARWGW